MKRIIYILGLLAVTLSACEDWFDVQPKEELSSDILYSTVFTDIPSFSAICTFVFSPKRNVKPVLCFNPYFL